MWCHRSSPGLLLFLSCWFPALKTWRCVTCCVNLLTRSRRVGKQWVGHLVAGRYSMLFSYVVINKTNMNAEKEKILFVCWCYAPLWSRPVLQWIFSQTGQAHYKHYILLAYVNLFERYTFPLQPKTLFVNAGLASHHMAQLAKCYSECNVPAQLMTLVLFKLQLLQSLYVALASRKTKKT